MTDVAVKIRSPGDGQSVLRGNLAISILCGLIVIAVAHFERCQTGGR
jgi:hypothetical protein